MGPDFREPDAPDAVTSKAKQQSVGAFQDAVAALCGLAGEAPYATLLAPEVVQARARRPAARGGGVRVYGEVTLKSRSHGARSGA